MEILGHTQISGEIHTSGINFTGNNCSGAMTWRSGYQFAVGAGFALEFNEGQAGRIIIKAAHGSGKSVLDASFAIIDGAASLHILATHGSQNVSLTAEDAILNIRAMYNNTNIAYMVTYF